MVRHQPKQRKGQGTHVPTRFLSGLLALILISGIAQAADPGGADSVVAEGGVVYTAPKVEPAPGKKRSGKTTPPPRVAKPGVEAPIPERIPFAAEIILFAGETRVLREPRVARLAVGNGKALSAAVLDDDEILLIGNDVGTSSLHIWTGKGTGKRIKVTVMPADTARLTREIAGFLATVPNIRVTPIGDRIAVEGDDLSDADLEKVAQIGKHFPQVINFTSRVGWERMVHMEVKVVEFPTTKLRELGLKWSATGGVAVGSIWQPVAYGDDGPFQINLRTGEDNAAPITAPADSGLKAVPLPATLNLMSMVNLGLNAQLQMLASEGTATILAEPMLTARSGSQASFLAGGEFPYEVTTLNGPTVIFREYGVKLAIKPQVGQNGVIRAVLTSEVSNIDSSITTRAGPALSSRKTETEFNVRDGETIVLSGLLSRETSDSVDKVPFLGEVPILGALFRSKRYQNRETELVVFVTPRVVDSQGSDPKGLMASANRRLAPPAQKLDTGPVTRTDEPGHDFWWLAP